MKKVQILNENGQFVGTIGTDCKPNFNKVSEVTRQENTLLVPQGLTGSQLASWLKREKARQAKLEAKQAKQASKQATKVEATEVTKVEVNEASVILLTIITGAKQFTKTQKTLQTWLVNSQIDYLNTLIEMWTKQGKNAYFWYLGDKLGKGRIALEKKNLSIFKAQREYMNGPISTVRQIEMICEISPIYKYSPMGEYGGETINQIFIDMAKINEIL